MATQLASVSATSSRGNYAQPRASDYVFTRGTMFGGGQADSDWEKPDHAHGEVRKDRISSTMPSLLRYKVVEVPSVLSTQQITLLIEKLSCRRHSPILHNGDC